ncbi:MAG: hypothetical protein ACXW1D_00780 [Halobacteriota archaeon]
MNHTLVEYSREIAPKIRTMLRKKEILNEWKKEDATVQEQQEEIKDLQEALKSYIEETESDIVREIESLETDIKLAVKAAAKGTEYKAAELKAFFMARAKEKVEDVVEKGAKFAKLEQELA